MTSRKSSGNPQLFTFRSAFSQSFLFPLLGMAALILVFPVSASVYLSNLRTQYLENAASGGKLESLSDTMRFVMCMEPTILSILAFAAVVAMSVLLGVMMFKFISNKRTVNVYYSLGITRTSMFISRYAAGLIMLVAAVAVPMIICGIVNVVFIGSSSQLWSAVFYQIFGFSTLAFVCYSITAAVFSCVGTIVEGIGFSAVVLAAPTVAISCVQTFVEKLLYGSAYGHHFTTAVGEYENSVSLVKELSAFNPITFFKELSTRYMSCYVSGDEMFLFSTGETVNWEAPRILPLLAWALVGVAALVIGLLLFKRRKAEICGFIGTSKVLNFVVTFVVGFFGYSLAMEFVGTLPTIAAVLLGLVVFAVIYCVIDFALIRGLRLFAKGLYKLPIHLAAAGVITLVFVTGCFGFSSRVPELESIESAQISSLVGVPLLCDGAYRDGNYYSFGGDDTGATKTISAGMIGKFTTQIDIELVRSLHEDFIKLKDAGLSDADKYTVPMAIRYSLTNGKTMTRYYNYADMDTILKTLELENTDFYQSRVKTNFADKVVSTPENEREYIGASGQYANQCLAYNGSSVIAVSPLLKSFNKLQLTEEQHTLLKACIAEDWLNMTVDERHFSAAPAMGVIWFAENRLFESEKDVELSGDALPGDSATDENTPPYAEMFDYDGNPGSDCVVTVYPTMTKTIDFLQKNGFAQQFEETQTVKKAQLRKWFVNKQAWSYSVGNSIALEFAADAAQQKNYYFDVNVNDSSAKQQGVVIENAEQIEQLKGLLRTRYFTRDSGYFCTLTFDDGTVNELYIPEGEIPDFVEMTNTGS